MVEILWIFFLCFPDTRLRSIWWDIMSTALITLLLTNCSLRPVIPIHACNLAISASLMISSHFSFILSRLTLNRRALYIESFPPLVFPPLLFNLHCAVRYLLPMNLHVYDASINTGPWCACLPDNTVVIITDWPHMSSKHWESHVRSLTV